MGLQLVWRPLLVLLALAWAPVAGTIPVSGTLPDMFTGSLFPHDRAAAKSVPSLETFSETLPSANSHQVVGVYVSGKLALRVLEQPAGQPGYVTSQADAASRFGLAGRFGTVGLIAHNTLAGGSFISLGDGDRIVVFYADGERQVYVVERTRQLQAVSPWSPTSSFLDLEAPSALISAQTLFNQVYAGGFPVVLQTCLSKGENSVWGRLFVLARPAPSQMEAAVAAKLARLLGASG
ncbi:MAG: hypothetical protein WBR18_01520 [Anaerolineales bacterium]